MSLLFSIVIPTYNRAHLLQKTISTVLGQHYKNFELIVIDDGSTDNTAEVVKAIAASRSEKITYLYQVNSERSAARNKGLKQAAGDYVIFFDSDDSFYPNHLQVAHDYILAHNRPEFLHLRYDIKNGEGKMTGKAPIFKGFPNRQLIKGNFLSCNGVIIRKDIALNNQFNEDRKLSAMEDWELWLRLSAQYPLHYINTITSSVINHDMRSVVLARKEALKNSATLLIKYVTSNANAMHFYKGQIHRFKSSCYSYISLHLALIGNCRKEAVSFLFRSLLQWPFFIFKRRFFAILKHLW